MEKVRLVMLWWLFKLGDGYLRVQNTIFFTIAYVWNLSKKHSKYDFLAIKYKSLKHQIRSGIVYIE